MNQRARADRYSMILEWEPEGGVYVVTVPELPGCQTHGTTRAEAVRQGQEAIAGWIEDARSAGESVPLPAVFDMARLDDDRDAVAVETGEVAIR